MELLEKDLRELTGVHLKENDFLIGPVLNPSVEPIFRLCPKKTAFINILFVPYQIALKLVLS